MLDAWSKCLVAIYQEKEKPEQPIEYVPSSLRSRARSLASWRHRRPPRAGHRTRVAGCRPLQPSLARRAAPVPAACSAVAVAAAAVRLLRADACGLCLCISRFVEEWFGQKKNAEIAELKDKIAALEESLALAQQEITVLKTPPEAVEDDEN